LVRQAGMVQQQRCTGAASPECVALVGSFEPTLAGLLWFITC
jgi:hypothetical protein